jgi:hypothetical protein
MVWMGSVQECIESEKRVTNQVNRREGRKKERKKEERKRITV